MDLGSKGKTPRVGARLKALDEAVLMAVSDFSCNFFCILSPRFEQCVLLPYACFFLLMKRKKCRPGGVIVKVSACQCECASREDG